MAGGAKEERLPTKLRSCTDRKKGESGSGEWRSINPPGGAPPAPLPVAVFPDPTTLPPAPALARPSDELAGEETEETWASQLGLRPSVGALESQLARRISLLYEATLGPAGKSDPLFG